MTPTTVIAPRHQSIIKDMALAPEGYKKLEWAQRHMPVLWLPESRF